MNWISLLFQLFVGVCMVSGLNLLADIATSLRGLNRRDTFSAGIVDALWKIRKALEKERV